MHEFAFLESQAMFHHIATRSLESSNLGRQGSDTRTKGTLEVCSFVYFIRFCLHPKRRYINALLVALAVFFSYQVLEPPRALNASGLLGRFHRCTHCIHHHQFDMADRIRSGAVLEESVFLIWDFEFSGMSAFSLRKHTAQPWLLNTRLTFFSPRGSQDATDHHQKHQKQVVLGR